MEIVLGDHFHTQGDGGEGTRLVKCLREVEGQRFWG
jgi:hypothetical protein